ncbi:hypothetical protein ACFX2A_046108 [Malus domestica]
MLLQLLVEAVNNGWCDANGVISKQTIEAKIVPALNEKLGCKKIEDHVKNRTKTLKGRFQSISRFLDTVLIWWDPVTKKLTASDEVILYIMSENMFEEEMEREDEEYHEAIKLLLMAVQAIVQVLNVLMLCDVLTEKTHLKGTRFICIEEMVATFLLTFGQNSRYCQTQDTFRRSHFTTSKTFNNVLKALNTIAPDLMVQPGSTVPTKIRESTRFYPYFKDCVRAIDGTHIPVMLLLHAIDTFNANVVLVLGQEKLWSMIRNVLKNKPAVDVVKLQKSGGVVSRNAKFRQKSRSHRIREYFYGLANDLSPHSNIANFSDFSVFRIGGGPQAPRSALPIGAEPAADPTRLAPVNINRDLLHTVLAVSFAKEPDQIISSNDAGFVFVTDVDIQRKTITYLAPSAGELPSKYLIAGTVTWLET